jgi:hypothetical protein
MKKAAGLLLAIAFTFSSCISFKRLDSRIAMDRNVCKKLYGKVVLYAIFVDTKYTRPWTEYDIQSTLDSAKLAIEWMEKKAAEHNIDLDIELQYYSNEKIDPGKCRSSA